MYPAHLYLFSIVNKKTRDAGLRKRVTCYLFQPFHRILPEFGDRRRINVVLAVLLLHGGPHADGDVFHQLDAQDWVIKMLIEQIDTCQRVLLSPLVLYRMCDTEHDHSNESRPMPSFSGWRQQIYFTTSIIPIYTISRGI